MLQNHFKYAFRNIIRSKLYSVINITGLSISLVAFILMVLYIQDELSFDRFHANGEQIYRVVDDKETPGVTVHSAQSAAPVAPALLAEYPGLVDAVRLLSVEGLVKNGTRIFEERKIMYADASFFNVFSFDLEAGNKDALKDPFSLVLTRKMADKYFGNEASIGKPISVDGKMYKVTGIMKDVPPNSHINLDFLLSMSTAELKGSGADWLFTNWYSNQFHTYVRVANNYNIANLQSQMDAFDKRHREAGGTTRHRYAFEKLTDIYLYSDRDDQIGKTGSSSNLFVFSAIAAFLLAIACINFINLSTARFASRAKEVGVKKVAGAGRGQLVQQFFAESFLLTAASLLIAIAGVQLLLPVFNDFSGKSVSIDLRQPVQLLTLLVLLSAVALLAGAYPAVYLSRLKPIASLKGKVSNSSWSVNFRKGLVVFQFATSTVLVFCTIVIYNQMKYMQNKELGFKAGQTMVINFEGDANVQQRLKAIKTTLAAVPGVESITASSNVPGDARQGNWSMDFVKTSGDTLQTELPVYLVDFNYLKQYEVSIVAGRELSPAYPMDTSESMLLNETAIAKLGFAKADDAIGTRVRMYPTDAVVVGVFKDFHYESLQKPLAPLAMRVLPSNYRLLSIKLTGNDNITTAIATISAKWKELVPERPIEFSFLNDGFNMQYIAEVRFGKVFAVFAGIAISIACLGLFALALFSVQQRTKEIGIRKVLGAGVPHITLNLSKQFMWLVFIGVLIASPIAWLLMNNWLQHFAFRVVPGIWVFVAAGSAALIISLLTISYHTIRAAIANPVISLRSE